MWVEIRPNTIGEHRKNIIPIATLTTKGATPQTSTPLQPVALLPDRTLVKTRTSFPLYNTVNPLPITKKAKDMKPPELPNLSSNWCFEPAPDVATSPLILVTDDKPRSKLPRGEDPSDPMRLLGAKSPVNQHPYTYK